MAAAALFTVLADENVMIPAAKLRYGSSNHTMKVLYTVHIIYQRG